MNQEAPVGIGFLKEGTFRSAPFVYTSWDIMANYICRFLHRFSTCPLSIRWDRDQIIYLWPFQKRSQASWPLYMVLPLSGLLGKYLNFWWDRPQKYKTISTLKGPSLTLGLPLWEFTLGEPIRSTRRRRSILFQITWLKWTIFTIR